MSDLPTRAEACAITLLGLSPTIDVMAIRIVRAYGFEKLKTEAEWRESLTQIGWFNPDSKRFCYSDEKETYPGYNIRYVVPVFAAALTQELAEEPNNG